MLVLGGGSVSNKICKKVNGVTHCPSCFREPNFEVMNLLPLFCLAVLALAGCATSGSAKERPNPAGVYRETTDSPPMFIMEEFTLRPDGSGTNRLSSTLVKKGKKVSAAQGRGQGKWYFKGKRLYYESTNVFTSDFEGIESPITRKMTHIFEIDENGDLLRIPPRGHPYVAGRFVKQK